MTTIKKIAFTRHPVRVHRILRTPSLRDCLFRKFRAGSSAFFVYDHARKSGPVQLRRRRRRHLRINQNNGV